MSDRPPPGSLRSMRISFDILTRLSPELAASWQGQFGVCGAVMVPEEDWDRAVAESARLKALIAETLRANQIKKEIT